jgi:hypothetical protein
MSSYNIHKLVKVNDSFDVNRYDNGWMVQINGRDKEDDYKTMKVICNTEDELIDLIKAYNELDLVD